MSRYRCDNCDYTADEDDLPDAKELSLRLTPGGKYTDKECPKCGALCFPVERRKKIGKPTPLAESLYALARRWRRSCGRPGGACVQQEDMNLRADQATKKCADELKRILDGEAGGAKKRLVIVDRIFSAGDHPPSAVIGALLTAKTEDELRALWFDWREEVEHPDADSQFIDWLVEKGHGERPAFDWDIIEIRD